MTTQDFSDRFDVLLNSYRVQVPYGSVTTPASLDLNEHEKSVLLTEAQIQIVKEYYAAGAESIEKIRKSLGTLTRTATVTSLSQSESNRLSKGYSYIIKPDQIPSDLMYILYEQVDYSDDPICPALNRGVVVVPVQHDDYYYTMRNPFKWANENRVLRLDVATQNGEEIELISKYPIERYLMRYIKRPRPIVLAPLPDYAAIEGVYAVTECELSEEVHNEILERAVALAIQRLGVVQEKQSDN